MPDDAEVGSAFVDILPDMDRFVSELAAGLAAATKTASATVGVQAALDQFTAEVAAAISAADQSKVTIPVTADTSRLVGDLAASHVLAGDYTEAHQLSFDLGADDTKLLTGLAGAEAAGIDFAGKDFDAKLGFDVDLAGLAAQEAAAQSIIDAGSVGGGTGSPAAAVADVLGAGGGGRRIGGAAAAAAGDGGKMPPWFQHFMLGAITGDIIGGRGMPGMGLAGSIPWKDLLGLSPAHLAMTGVGAGTAAAGGAIGGGLVAGGSLLTSLTGMTSDLMGHGLLGLGSLGTAVVGGGTDLAGTAQAAKDIKSVEANVRTLSIATAQFGSMSAQAQAAQRSLNTAMLGFAPAARPAILAAAQTAQQFHTLFQTLTAGAVVAGSQLIQQITHVATSFLPTIGQDAQRNTRLIQANLQPLFAWLQSSGPNGGLGIFQNLNNIFTSHLPTTIHAATQGFEVFAKAINDAAGYTGALTKRLDAFFTRWNSAAGTLRLANDIGNSIHRMQTNASIAHTARQPFDQWAKSNQSINGQAVGGVAIFENLNKLFTAKLATSVQVWTGALELLVKVLDIAANSTGNFMTKLDAFLQKWNSPAQEPALVHGVHTLIDDFHLLTGLLGSVTNLAMAFLHLDAGTGQAIFSNLTNATKALTGWVNSVQGAALLGPMFAAHKQQTMDLLTTIEHLIATVGPGLIQLVTTLSGVADQLVTMLGTALGPVINTLTTDLAPLLQQFVTDLGPVLDVLSQQLPGVIDSLGQALGPTLDGLSQGLTSLLSALGPAVQQVLDALGPALGPTLSALGTGLGDLITGLAPILAQVVPPFGTLVTIVANLGPVLPPLGLAIANLVIALEPLIPTLANLTAGGLTTLASSLTDLLVAVTPLVPPLVSFIDAILKIPGVSNLAGLAIGLGLLHAILPSFATDIFALSKAKDAEMVPTFLGRMVQPIKDLAASGMAYVGAQLKSLALIAYDTIAAGVSAVWGGMVNLAKVAWSAIASGAQAAWGALVNLAKVAWSAIVSGVTAAAGALVNLAKVAWTGIVDGVTAAWGAVVRLAGIAWSALASGLAAAATALGELAMAAAAAAWEGIATSVGFLASGLLTLVTALIPATAGMIGFDIAADANIVGAVVIAVAALAAGLYLLITHWDEVVKFLHGPWGTAISAAVWSFYPIIGIAMLLIGHWQTVINTLGSVWAAFKGAIGDVATFFGGLKDWFTHIMDGCVTWLTGAGEQIIHGLVDGIDKGVVGLVDHIGKVGGSIVGAFTKALGIHSPSQVMHDQVGLPIAQGLGSGILDGSSAAIDAAKQVSTQITDAFGNLSNPAKVASAVQALASVFQNLATVFTNLQTVATNAGKVTGNLATVETALSSMAGKMPEIAGAIGQVVDALGGLAGGGKGGKGGAGGQLGGLATLFDNIGKLFGGIGSAAGTAAQATVPNIDAVAKALYALAADAPFIVGGLDAMMSGLGKIGADTKALGDVTNALKAIAGAFAALGTAVGAATNLGASGAGQANVLGTALTTLSSVSTVVVASLSALASSLKGIDLGGAGKQLGDLANEVKALGGVFDQITSTTKSAAGVPASMGAIVTAIGTVADAMTKIPASVAAATPGIVASFAAFGTAVTDYFSKTLDPSLVTAGTNMVGSVESGAATAAGATGVLAFQAIGQELMAGLVTGIGHGAPSVSAAATAAAGAATTATKSAFGVASPSAVFHDIGASLMEGLGNGITRGFAEHVAPAIRSASDSLVSGFGSPSFHLGTSGSGTLATTAPVTAPAPTTISATYKTTITGAGGDLGEVRQMVHAAMAEHDEQLVSVVFANRVGGTKG